MNEPDKISSHMQKVMIEKANTVIDIAYKSLVTDRENNKLPLQIFDQYFAPYFFQGVAIPEGADVFETWIGIAGSPIAPVDIIDNGQIVFTVPPLYDTSLINMISDKRGTSRVMDQLSLYNNRAPGTIDKFMEEELLPTADSIVNDKGMIINEWEAIANRYKVEETKIDEKITGVNHDDDDLSYD